MTLLRVLLSLSAVLALANGVCFDNGDKEIGGKCFKFVAKQLSFEDARNYCHYTSSNPAYLAYVPDQFTANFLASYARSLFNTNDGFFWIGLSRTKSYNPWTWDTGFQLAWSNFNGNQLSDNFVAESIVNGKWNTFGDDTKLYFVCSYDPTAPPTFAPPASTTPGTTTSTTTTTSVPTTTGAQCVSYDPYPSFLFAYSNDLDRQVVYSSRSIMNGIFTAYPRMKKFALFGNVRFDLKTAENITYSGNHSAMDVSISQHLPDSNLGFKDSSTESDVIRVLNNFLDSNPPCGSRALVLLKRNVNHPEVPSDLLNRIRRRHLLITFIGSSQPSGGLYQHVMYDLATRSNGYYVFNNDTDFSGSVNVQLTYFFGYQLLYSQNVVVEGNGTMQLPILSVPYYGNSVSVDVGVNLQDNASLDALNSFNMTLHPVTSGWDYEMTVIKDKMIDFYGTSSYISYGFYSRANYTVTLSYSYQGRGALEIRMYTDSQVPTWPPYSD